MKRLKTLLVANNRVSRIGDGIGGSLPTLQHVILTNNRISSLGEVRALCALPALTTLVLLGNPVTRQAHYRHFVINAAPALTSLDFQRVRPAERAAAAKLFRSKAGKAYAEEVERKRFSGAGGAGGGAGGGDAAAAPQVPRPLELAFTPEQLARISEAISSATTREEVEELEVWLRKGQLPPALVAAAAALASGPPKAEGTVTLHQAEATTASEVTSGALLEERDS